MRLPLMPLVVFDILVEDRWNATAAKNFFKRLLQNLQYRTRCLVTVEPKFERARALTRAFADHSSGVPPPTEILIELPRKAAQY
jgi:hypothetical protein